MKNKGLILMAAALCLSGILLAETEEDIRIEGSPHGEGLDVILRVAEGFTNRVELYVCPDLRSNVWAVVAENLMPAGTNPAVWYTPIEDEGFFAAGNMDVDSDTDGLCDAREIYIHKTKPDNPDSDNDSNPDSQELYVDHTDPNNPDAAPPLVWITAPAGGTEKVVLL